MIRIVSSDLAFVCPPLSSTGKDNGREVHTLDLQKIRVLRLWVPNDMEAP